MGSSSLFIFIFFPITALWNPTNKKIVALWDSCLNSNISTLTIKIGNIQLLQISFPATCQFAGENWFLTHVHDQVKSYQLTYNINASPRYRNSFLKFHNNSSCFLTTPFMWTSTMEAKFESPNLKVVFNQPMTELHRLHQST